MSIRTSIYDFFAYVIPGGLLLIAVLLGLEMLGVVGVLEKLYKADFTTLLVMVVVSYVIGHVTGAINSRWTRLFESRPIHMLAFEEFKNLHPTIQNDINPNDWQIWFASIRRESMELTLEVDRQMATSYLLRGVSSFFALICLIIVIGVIAGRVDWWFVFLPLFRWFFPILQLKKVLSLTSGFTFLFSS